MSSMEIIFWGKYHQWFSWQHFIIIDKYLTKPRPVEGCPIGTFDGISTCFCEDHCSWEICKLDKAPSSCLPDKNFHWSWDSESLYWRTKDSGKY